MTIPPTDVSSAAVFFRAATQPSRGGPGRAAEAHRSIDWDRLIAVALLENSVTLLNDRLDSLADADVPGDVRERIGRLALIWKFKLHLLEKRLRESISVLASEEIEVTLLKGAALALTVYPSFADRPMADLDIMVAPDLARWAHAVLQHAGWEVETGNRSPGTWDDHHHLPPLVDRDGSGLRLELHVAPLEPGNPFRLSAHELVDSARLIDLDGHRVRVPEPHLHAVHAAIHFAYSHQFTSGGLNIFRDIAMLSAAGALDWDAFTETACRTGSESCCYWTIRLARELGGVSVPDDVMQRLEPRIGSWSLSILDQHFSQLILRASNSCPSVELRNRLWAFALQVTPPDSTRSRRWDDALDIDRPRQSSLRRLITHLGRAPRWSRYVASLVAPVLELSA